MRTAEDQRRLVAALDEHLGYYERWVREDRERLQRTQAALDELVLWRARAAAGKRLRDSD